MAIAGWGADFPTGVGFFQSITNGNSILPTGNSNYPSLNDPTVNSILTAAPKGQDHRRGLEEAEPGRHGLHASTSRSCGQKTLYYRNPRMTNVTSNNALAFGIYDFVNVGVSG